MNEPTTARANDNTTKPGRSAVGFFMLLLALLLACASFASPRVAWAEGEQARIDTTDYATLADAIDASVEGDTIILLTDIDNSVDAADYTGALRYSLKAGTTLDGSGKTISGHVGIWISAAGGTIRNVNFKDIHNDAAVPAEKLEQYGWESKVGNQSAIYCSGLTGDLVITNCTFDNIDWDAIEIAGKASTAATISITGNTFRQTNPQTKQLRYIHIEFSPSVKLTSVTITGNAFYDLESVDEGQLSGSVEVYGLSMITPSDLSLNYFEDLLSTQVASLSATKLFPMRDKNGSEFTPIAYAAATTSKSGSFWVTLQEALDDLSRSPITLTADCDENATVPSERSVSINMNGHALSGTIVNNGTLTLSGSNKIASDSGTIVNNGTLVLNGTSTIAYTVENNGRTNIIGGTGFDLKNITGAGELVITAGTFLTEPDAASLPTYYKITEQSDGTFKVSKMSVSEALEYGLVATTGSASGTFYSSLTEGFAVATSLYLQTDSDEAARILCEGAAYSRILYLNGHEFTGSIEMDDAVEYVRIAAHNSKGGSAALRSVEGSKLAIGNEKYAVAASIMDGSLDVLEVSCKGSCTIKGGLYGGVIVNDSYDASTGDLQYQGQLVITGGTFASDTVTVAYTNHPDGTESEEVSLADYLAPGYELVANGDGTYTVQFKTYDAVYLNGDSGNDANAGDSEASAVKTLDRALELVSEGGTIYICGQVTISGSVDLEDVAFKRAEGYKGTLFWLVGQNASVTLTGVTVDGNRDVVTGLSAGNAMLFSVQNGASLVIEEGTKLVNNGDTAIWVRPSNLSKRTSLVMNGGEISNNVATGDFAYVGGVYVDYDAEFTMNDGAIKNNEGNKAGGVYIGCGFPQNGFDAATFTMSGGEISGNISERCGGGVYCEGVAVLSGGEIKNNEAEWAGGLAVVGEADVTLDGAAVSENTAAGNGAGVYVEGFEINGGPTGVGAVFTMKSGSIVDNTSEYGVGGGIFAYFWTLPATVRISGGTISGNVCEWEENGSAVALGGDFDSGMSDYAVLELSGDPSISGDVLFSNDCVWDDDTETSKPLESAPIKVVGELDVEEPIVINRCDDTLGIPAVEFSAGIDVDAAAFKSGSLSEVLVVDGRALVWVDAVIVSYYDDQDVEYEAYRQSVIVGEKIDAALAPTPGAREGYVLAGWQYNADTSGGSDWKAWDFENDAVSDANLKLYELWALAEPTVKLAADNESPHVGDTVKLEATAAHALDAEYAYQWYTIGEDGAEAAIDGATDSVLEVTGSGTYAVRVTATVDDKSSSATEDIVVTFSDHKLVKVSAVAPTYTDAGNIEHWMCETCGGLFLDEDGTVGATAADVTLPKLDPTIAIVGDAERAVRIGETLQLEVSVKPDGSDIVWTTSDAEVAKVDADGAVSALGAGEADITATANGVSVVFKVSVSKKVAPAAPVVQGVNETVQGKADGAILGVSSAMEYRAEGANAWTPCAGDELTGLAAGIYEVRVAETADTEAGQIARIVIAAGDEPTYTLNVSAPAFEAVSYGYGQPAAQPLTISSTGNSAATITSVAVSGEAFAIGGSGGAVEAGGSISTWMIQPKAGLSAGVYEETVTVTYVDGATATAPVSFTVDAAAQDVPAAPAIEAVSYTSITLVEVGPAPSGAAAQYSIDGGATWQESPTFEHLMPGASYSFTVRYAPTDDGNYQASAASASASGSTLAFGATDETVDFADEEGLESEREAIQDALASDDYSDEEKRELTERLDAIEGALETLEKVRTIRTLIDDLPAFDDITLDDADAIQDAKAAYDELGEHERALVGDEYRDALDAAVEALAKLEDPDDPEPPVDPDDPDEPTDPEDPDDPDEPTDPDDPEDPDPVDPDDPDAPGSSDPDDPSTSVTPDPEEPKAEKPADESKLPGTGDSATALAAAIAVGGAAAAGAGALLITRRRNRR